MATLQAQVEGLTSLSVGTTPTAAELTEFLKDGVIDVTNRWLLVRPQDMEDFVRGSSTQSSNGFATSGADISSVIREAGADGDTDGSTAWKDCRKVPSSMRSKVVDTDSLHFASKYNPVYIINNNSAVNVYPVPDGTDDGYRVYYVNNEPKGDGLVDALAAGHTTIGYFPKNKVYLVVLYAGIKSLQANLGAMGISTFSLSASAPASIPSAPAITGVSVGAVTIASLPSAPAYSKPTITTKVSFEDFFNLLEDGNPFGDSDPGTFSTSTPPSLGTASFSTPGIATVTVASFGTPPAYAAPTVTGDTQEITGTIVAGAQANATDQLNFMHWYDVLADMIETEEDTELASAQIQKISSFLQAYSAAMQNQLNIFNDANVEYQATIQEKIKDADLAYQESQQEAQLLLQKEMQEYSSKVQEYQAEVAKDVQLYTKNLERYQAEINLAFQAWSKTEADSIQTFQIDIQNELNEFNKENAIYQAGLQRNLQQAQIDMQDAQKEADIDLQEKIQDYTLELQRVSTDQQKYQALVNAEIQTYQQEVAEKNAEYQWMAARLKDLKEEYDRAFLLAAPKQQAST